MSITPYLIHPAINALGWTLFHALWQFVVVFILWKLSLIVLRKAGPSIRYKVSVAALLALPIISAFTFVRQYQVYASAGRIISIESGSEQLAIAGNQAYYLLEKTYPFHLKQLEAYTPWVFWIYVCGLLFFSIKSVFTYFYFSRLSLKNGQKPSPQWTDRIEQLLIQTGLSIKTRILESPYISTPAVWGFLKPMILLPLGMLNGLSTAQVEALLLHEMYHIARKDHWLNFIQNLLEVLLFFHPVTWLISRRIRLERESCVDALVVAQTSAPLDYAHALVSLSEQKQKTLKPSLAAVNSKNQLLTRIKNIMLMKPVRANTGQKLAAVVTICAAVFSIAWMNPRTPFNHMNNQPFELAYIETATTPRPDTNTRQAQRWHDDDKHEYYKASSITLDNGRVVQWNELSPEEQEALANAMADATIALTEASVTIAEVVAVNVTDAALALTEASLNILGTFLNHAEMKEAREEVRRARQEVSREIQKEFGDPRFREEMRRDMEQAREEIKQAMREWQQDTCLRNAQKQLPAQEFRNAAQTIQEFFQSEQFQKDMQQAADEMRTAGKQLKETDWNQISKDLNAAFEEMGKAFEQAAKSLNSTSTKTEEKQEPKKP